MDHENYPVMLPSNQIYSLRGLEATKKVIKPSLGKYIEQYYCKFTSTWYNKEQAKKVYLAWDFDEVINSMCFYNLLTVSLLILWFKLMDWL